MLIGVDTNVLARIFLEDNPSQTLIAQQFLREMAKKDRLFIASYTILELVWVLGVKHKSKSQIIESIEVLLETKGVTVGQHFTVLRALEKYREGKADIADYMIIEEGADNHVHKLASFDKILLKDSAKNCINPDTFF